MTGCIAVFGGTGFIGRHLVPQLLESGKTVRVAIRDPGGIGIPTEPTKATEIVQADILDKTSVDRAMVGADAVFNLVGILTETAAQTIVPFTSKAPARSR